MIIVDTHCHTGLDKYEPVESLIHHMQYSGVARAVLIQHGGISDNEYHAECLKRFPGRFQAAMIVPSNDDGSTIGMWANRGILGIRLAANARIEGTDSLAQWRTAAELGLVVSATGNPRSFCGPEFTEVVETFPQLRIVIGHLGGVAPNLSPPFAEWKQLLGLACYPNLTIKLPGFGEFCRLPYPFTTVPPIARLTVTAFGPRRVMWGSDYPPVSNREGYDNSLRFPLRYFDDLGESDLTWIFGGTALDVWKFST